MKSVGLPWLSLTPIVQRRFVVCRNEEENLSFWRRLVYLKSDFLNWDKETCCNVLVNFVNVHCTRSDYIRSLVNYGK